MEIVVALGRRCERDDRELTQFGAIGHDAVQFLLAADAVVMQSHAARHAARALAERRCTVHLGAVIAVRAARP